MKPQNPAKPTIARFDPKRARWKGIEAIPYKGSQDGTHSWKGVERFVMLGREGEPAAFQLRYFEIAPGGFSSFERHRHVHAVLILRGRGTLKMGDSTYRLRPLDFVYIPPEVAHQFRAGREPFGFLCAVDAARDRPRRA